MECGCAASYDMPSQLKPDPLGGHADIGGERECVTTTVNL
jgi:hypothetical protein